MDLLFVDVDEQLHRHSTLVTRARSRAVDLSALQSRLDTSWIFHDLSLEGAVFRSNELERGLSGRSGANWSENWLLDRVRSLKDCIGYARHHASLREPFELDTIKALHRRLHPADEQAGMYRKERGRSTAYRHDVAEPAAISYQLRRLVARVKTEGDASHAISTACRIHRGLIAIFPFNQDNGIIARLAMNTWLLRHGYPPAIIHIRDRQRYWDSYLSHNGAFKRLVIDSIMGSLNARIGLMAAA